jgi:AcrR family transcriptional regulator
VSTDSPGARLRARRLARGMSLRSVAATVGMSPSALSYFENGVSVPSPDRLRTLEEALDIELLPPENPRPDVSDWRSYRPDAHDAVLRAALEEFTERGFHGATIRAIAERSGVSAPTVYHYYPSKQAMLDTIVADDMDEMLLRAQAAITSADSPTGRFTNLVMSLALHHVHRQQAARVGASELRMLDQDARERHVAARREVLDLVEDEIRHLVSTGLATALPGRSTGRAIVMMCAGVAGWYRPGERAPEEVAIEHANLALRMIGAVPRWQ